MQTCPDCHSQVSDSAVFCDNCGYPLKSTANTPQSQSGAGLVSPPLRSGVINPLIATPATVNAAPGTCSSCGYANTPGEMFCQNCGVQLAPIASAPPPLPTPVSASAAQSQPPVQKPRPSESGLCPACGHFNPPGETFCQNCGVDLTGPQEISTVVTQESTPLAGNTPQELPTSVTNIATKCTVCGYTNPPGESFCQNCGVDLASTALSGNSYPLQATPAAKSPGPVPQPLDASPTGACPSCGSIPPAEAVFCPNCGMQLTKLPVSILHPIPNTPPVAGSPLEKPNQPPPCSTCGMVNSPGEVYCQNCGMELAAVPQPNSPEPPVSTSQPQPKTPSICPACNYTNPPGEMYCQNCGLLLVESEVEPTASMPEAIPMATSQTPSPESEPVSKAFAPQPATPDTKPLSSLSKPPSTSPNPLPARIGHLVVTETKASLPLPYDKTEFLIGRADPAGGIFPDIDLSQHGGENGGVSRQHARLTINGAQVLIEDLNSMNSTFLNKQKLTPNQRVPLSDGDEIRLGRLVLIFYSS